MSQKTKGEGSSSPADDFLTARTSLRDTIKWLIAALAAVAAAIVGGVPLVQLGALAGANLYIAAIAGVVAVGLILWALNLALDLLLSDSFYLSSLSEPFAANVKKKLETYQHDLVSVRFASLEQFLTSRTELRQRVQAFGNLPPEQRTKDEAELIKDQHEAIAAAERLIVAAGHFELLAERARTRIPQLLKLAFFTSVCLVVVVWALGGKGGEKQSNTTTITIDPGKEWAAIGKAMALKCGDQGPIKAVLREPPKLGWAVLDLQAGGGCENVMITLPASLIAAPLGAETSPLPKAKN